MTEILIGLEENLRKQLGYYQGLAELERQKQQALVNNVIEEIENITAQEEKILLEVGRLEEERLYWAEFFAKETGKKAEEIVLADLVDCYPGLESVRRGLEKEIYALKDLNEINTKLLENAVSLVNLTIRLLTEQKQTTYFNPGDKAAKKKNNGKSFIDKSI